MMENEVQEWIDYLGRNKRHLRGYVRSTESYFHEHVGIKNLKEGFRRLNSNEHRFRECLFRLSVVKICKKVLLKFSSIPEDGWTDDVKKDWAVFREVLKDWFTKEEA